MTSAACASALICIGKVNAPCVKPFTNDAGISKLACVGYGSGAELVTPLAVAGAVDAWAMAHGRASRRLAVKAQSPGIIQVRGPHPLMTRVLIWL